MFDEDDEHLVDAQTARLLRTFVERIERLHAERDHLAKDISDIYAEVKASGHDANAVKTVVKLRRKDPAALQREQALVDVYLRALGVDTSSARMAPDDFLNLDDDDFPSEMEGKATGASPPLP